MDHKDFKGHLEVMFNTEAGKSALAYLQELYVNSSCLEDTVERTYYSLGQKELIQGFIRTLKDPNVLEDIKVYN